LIDRNITEITQKNVVNPWAWLKSHHLLFGRGYRLKQRYALERLLSGYRKIFKEIVPCHPKMFTT
jgi:hypothetical protein